MDRGLILFFYSIILIMGSRAVEAGINLAVYNKVEKLAEAKGWDLKEGHYYSFIGQIYMISFWGKVLFLLGIKGFELTEKDN